MCLVDVKVSCFVIEVHFLTVRTIYIFINTERSHPVVLSNNLVTVSISGNLFSSVTYFWVLYVILIWAGQTC